MATCGILQGHQEESMDLITQEQIEALEPSRVWHYFYEISQIPRESENETQVREYLRQFAHKHDLAYSIDDAGNMVIRKAPSSGREHTPGLIFQGHMDMVCVKDPDSDHDFTKDPIPLAQDGDWMRAWGTTLGADNGIALALILALFEDDSLDHGPLEAILTVAEETGLEGAFGLNMSQISGRMLINLDSEEEGVFYIGSAGGAEVTGTADLSWELTEGNCLSWLPYTLTLSGFSGGHSGADIHTGRANAVKECFRILKAVSRLCPIRIASLSGGTKRNVIPSSCTAVFLIPPENEETLQAIFSELRDTIPKEYRETDPECSLTLDEAPMPDRVLTEAQSSSLITCIYLVPHGIAGMSNAVPGMVETSNNLASAYITETCIEIVTSQRSAVESKRVHISQTVAAALALCCTEVKEMNPYPAWTPDPQSQLPSMLSRVYTDLYGREPVITAIHAGLECGVINSKAPDMQSISMGPTMEHVHSTREQVHISSVARIYHFINEVVRRMA